MPYPVPFKRLDIQPCCICGQGIMHDNQITFVRVRGLDYLVITPEGVKRTHGLEQFFGGGNVGAALAHAMDDPELAKVTIPVSDKLVCLKCATETTLAEFIEIVSVPELLEPDPS